MASPGNERSRNSIVRKSVRAGAVVLALLPILLGEAVAQAKPVLKINAILPLTGPASFIGAGLSRSLGVIESTVNAQGGISGQRIHFVIADDQSNPQVDIQLINQLVSQHTAALIGPSTTAGCNAAAPLVLERGPVLYCLSPGILPRPDGFVFSSNASTRDTIAAMIRFFREKGAGRIAALTSLDATGEEVDRAVDLALALPENKSVQLVEREKFNVADLSVSAQVARIKAAGPQADIAWTAGTAFGTLLRGITDGGLNVQIGASNANMVYAQLRQYKAIAPAQLFFPGNLSLVRGAAGPEPIRDAQNEYFEALRKVGVLTPDGIDVAARDPAMIIVGALRKLGPDAMAAQVRDYILHLRGWTGINGVYNFGDGSQRGVGVGVIVIERWDPNEERFIAVSRPGGHPF
jgi:branched-chain amino acid transport system substrate-binding protein